LPVQTTPTPVNIVVPGDPIAGADFDYPIPANKCWNFKALIFKLTTDATAITRTVRVYLHDGTRYIWYGENDIGQTAGLGVYYSFSGGMSRAPSTTAATTLFRQFQLPDIPLNAGWHIATSITNLQAGDQVDHVAFAVDGQVS